MWNDEFLATEAGDIGTQIEGLGHIGVEIGAPGDKRRMRWHNGFSAAEMGSPCGLSTLGTEKLNPIVARAVRLESAAARGLDSEQKGEVITMNDVKVALKRPGMASFEFKEGDAILFRTGWEKRWDDPATFNNGCPGIGMEGARWVAEGVKAAVTGGDTRPDGRPHRLQLIDTGTGGTRDRPLAIPRSRSK